MKGFDTDDVGSVVGKTLVEEGRTIAQRYYAGSNPFGIEHKIASTDLVPWCGGNNLMLRKAFSVAGDYDSDRFTSGADVEFHQRMEKQHGYRTTYQPDAIIYYEARGSLKEFFQVAAKYTHDGYLRSTMEGMRHSSEKYRFFAIFKLGQIMKMIAGIAYRAAKATLGRDTWFRVVSNYFAISSLTGSLFGYMKARFEYLSSRKGNRG